MNRDYLIQLTQNLYRLTLFFPKKEPLRYKMRELADEILADSLQTIKNSKTVEDCSRPISEELEILDSYFEVARNQNWVPVVDVLRVQEEYNRIKAEIKKITEQSPPQAGVRLRSDPRVLAENCSLPIPNLRQEKILAILKEKGRAQVWQVKQVFPEVTKRTLRRDFENLLKQGIIERRGERNDTFYQLKVGQV